MTSSIHRVLVDIQKKCLELVVLTEVSTVDLERCVDQLAAAWFDAATALRTVSRDTDPASEPSHTCMLAILVLQRVLFELFAPRHPLPASELSRLRAVLHRLSTRIGHTLDLPPETAVIEAEPVFAPVTRDGRSAVGPITQAR